MRSMFLVALVSLACAHHAAGDAAGHNTTPVPPAVRKVVDDTLGKAAKIGVEHEGGATIYEAATTTKLELEVHEDGSVKQTEVAIPVASLPTAVAQAATARGKVSEAEVVLTAAGTLFEVEVGDTELTIDGTGKIVAEEHEADEPGEDRD